MYTKSGNGTLLWRVLPFPYASLEFEKLVIWHLFDEALLLLVCGRFRLRELIVFDFLSGHFWRIKRKTLITTTRGINGPGILF